MSDETIQSSFFPCEQLPQDAHQQKLIGLYRQIQPDLWLQRIKISGGRLTAEQWKGLGDIARKYTPLTPLHLTTRQDIELHDLDETRIPDVQLELANIGLSGFASAGDTLRNITVCPCSGLGLDSVELLPLANAIDSALKEIDGIYALPRKFKIGISCGQTCGQPWINDLGLTAIEKDGQLGFSVTAAGSLGPKPATGIRLFDWIDAQDAIAIVVAAVEVFKKYGDRENRHKARLRHVRERLGNERFVELITEAFFAAKKQYRRNDVQISKPKKNFTAGIVLKFSNGDVTPEAAHSLAMLQKRDDMEVRIDMYHRIKIFGTDETELHKTVAGYDVLSKENNQDACVVACPGKRWCKHGLVNTNEIAEMLRKKLSGRMGRDEVIGISGCPNGCAHSAVTTIGLSGCVATRDGEKVEAVNLFFGGEMGRSEKIGQLVAAKLTSQEAVTQIIDLLNKDDKNRN